MKMEKLSMNNNSRGYSPTFFYSTFIIAMNLTKKFTYSQAVQFIESNKATVKRLYIGKDLTGRIVAEKLNISYSNSFQKALLRVLGAKGKGLGGARLGSGNKKGIKFCHVCRKKLPCNCIHYSKNVAHEK